MDAEQIVAAMNRKGNVTGSYLLDHGRGIYYERDLRALIEAGMAMRKRFGDAWPEGRAWDKAIKEAAE